MMAGGTPILATLQTWYIQQEYYSHLLIDIVQ